MAANSQVSDWLVLVSVNSDVYLNATAWDGVFQGIYTYLLDPSTCVASDRQYWNTFSDFGASSRLINYLQSLENGRPNRIIVWPSLGIRIKDDRQRFCTF